jgi:N-acetylglucosaminyldiphosphoundecaprenol N-acetyl-beta-D-mannosaminyltransferase
VQNLLEYEEAEAQVESYRADRRARSLSGLRKRLAILGVPIDNLCLEDVLRIIERYIKDGGFHQIATANADFLIKAIDDAELMGILHECSMVLPDGMPVVWASHLLRHPLRERVTGADVVPRLAELAARKGYSIYLLGAEEERSAAAAAWIRKTHPGARIAGRYSPPLSSLEDMDHEFILRDIAKAKPDILLVAFGNPKQEKWLAMHRHRLNVPVCVGVGASLDFLSGVYHRAPSRMQAIGLEWLHRLYQEPMRLAPRYLSNASGLLRYFSMQLLAMSTQRKARRPFAMTQYWLDGTSIIRIEGDFAGEVAVEFDSLVHRTHKPGSRLVIDLTNTQEVDAHSLGTLISLRTRIQREFGELWLVGVKPGLRRVMRASILDQHFRFAPSVNLAMSRIEYAAAWSKQSASIGGLHEPRAVSPQSAL